MKKQRVLSVLLTVLFLLSAVPICTLSAASKSINISTDISSLSQTDIDKVMSSQVPYLLNDMKNNTSSYGITDSISSLSIGRSFQFASYGNDGAIAYNDSILYYPVYSKGSIVAILSLCKYGGNVSCALGVDFAPAINGLLNKGSSSVALIDDNGTLYAIDPSNNLQVLASTTKKETLTAQKKVAFSFNSVAEKKNSITKEDPSFYSYTTYRPGNMYSKGLTIFAEYAPYSKNLAGYQAVPQTVAGVQKNICWAATMASIVRFERPTSYSTLTAQQVCTDLNVPYVSEGWDIIQPGYTHYLGALYNTTVYYGALSNSTIISTINNSDPIAMSSTNLAGTSCHHTALCGYTMVDSALYTIRIMDPAYVTFKTATYSSSGWAYAFGSDTYVWNSGIKIR